MTIIHAVSVLTPVFRPDLMYRIQNDSPILSGLSQDVGSIADLGVLREVWEDQALPI